ncbi:F-box domain-containing protein [Favolaschia claudopus]|uniref:F-box domain-containing protein n=1 Tax=Favolaschia claudopus TaxID=2862362 RepID=A0AAW0A6P1_9AGAR
MSRMHLAHQRPGADSNLSTSALRARLGDIDAELAELRARVETLSAERKLIAAALDSVVYPILTLPIEITSEIFTHHVDGLQDSEVADDEDSRLCLVELESATSAGPLFLAQICRTWRAIALNMPSLWSRVQTPRLRRSERSSGLGKLLESWLARTTTNYPLHLKLESPGADDREPELIPSVAARYAVQWATFSCCLRWSARTSSVVDGLRGRLPLLRKLDIKVYTHASEGHLTSRITGFSVAPRLRKATIVLISPEWITLPWPQLTHLTLDSQSGRNIPKCIKIVSEMPHLEVLSIEWGGSHEERPVSVTLRNVRELQINNTDLADWTVDLLPYIVLPRLISLHVESRHASGKAQLATFLQRSQCLVQSLSFSSTFHSVMQVLLAMNQVKNLTFPSLEWKRQELAAFMRHIATVPHFLPDMRSLHIPICDTVIPFTEVANMLASRWHSSPRKLHSFRLIRNDEVDGIPDEIPDPAIAEKLRVLKDDGLEIQIESLLASGDEFSYDVRKPFFE